VRLVWKFSIPEICILVSLGLISYFVLSASVIVMREHYVKDVVENCFDRVIKEVQTNAQESARLTAMFTGLPEVRRAYEVAHSGEIDDPYSPQSQAARELLRKELAPILDGYSSQFGNKLQLHFHLPNARSLARVWRAKNTRIKGEDVDVSDDLSSYRPTVMDVIKSGQRVMGIELGSGGFAVRGVIPIHASDGTLIGTAEVLQDFNPILDALKLDGKIDLILYVNKERISIATDSRNPTAIATELQDPAKNPHKGDFVRVTAPKDDAIDALITPGLLSSGRNDRVFEYHGSTALATLPIYDYRNTQLGVLVCAMDIEPANKLARMTEMTLAFMLAGMAIMPFIVRLMIMRLQVAKPLNIIRAKILDIAEDRADLSQRISSHQQDEIGALANSFNVLTAKLIQDMDKQAQLIQRESEAKAANKAKSGFLAKMSHEIRTPMNAILGITEIQMQNAELPRNIKEAFGRIYTAGYTLLSIINDLLDMSKIEAGRMELSPQKYEIASLISDTVQLNLVRIGSKPIEFKLEVDADIPTELFGDELRIKQILNNLLSNAFKYTQQGEVVLSLSAEKSGQDENSKVTLVFRVRDTGQGMTAEQLDKLFDEYTRFDMATNRTVEGAGLGMTITRQLAHMMNGEILVESELDKGSTFTLRLPQGRIGAGTLGPELVKNLQQFKEGVSRLKMPRIVREPMPYGSVLIVDDLDINLLVGKGLMKPYGLSVDTALSGFEALDKIRSGKEYDIVFMDHMMPEMDGVETVKKMRDMGYTRSIVALTANAVAGQSEMFLQSGFDDFISKPIDLHQLNAVLNRLIRDMQTPEVLETARWQQGYTSAPQPSTDRQFAKIFIHDAEKTLMALEAIHANQYRREDDTHEYVVKVHAMRSSLANIGENKLASFAYRLEQAGRNGMTSVLAADTPSFLKELRAVIEKIKPKEEDASSKMPDGEPAFLCAKLSDIQTACAAYDKKAAKDALAELRQKSWSRQTEEQLDVVAEHLLHSEFEEAAEYCGRLLSEYDG